MARINYVNISIPEVLINDIDKVKDKKGYSSNAEFIKDAIRRLLIEIEKEDS